MNRVFCGRSGPLPVGDKFVELRLGMCRLLEAESDRMAESHSWPSAVIAVLTSAHEQFHICGQSLFGAYSGSPYWTRADLEGFARSEGMASSIAIGYKRHGMDLLKYLHGPFSLALIDNETHETCLAIDRMGICSLHFAQTDDGGLIFGNSGLSLRAHPGHPKQIRNQSIYDYLFFHVVPGPETIYDGQFKLTPGEFVVVDGKGQVRHQKYWAPTFDGPTATNRRRLEENLFSLLRQSVARCLPERSFGCFLSGGIDSSTIAGIASEFHAPAKTFTIGFREPGYDETSFARVTSDHFTTQQSEYFISPGDVVDAVSSLVAAHDEPFGNSSVVPTYFCARMAKSKGVDTLLAGDGGDELFGGNVRYVTQQIFAIYDWIPRSIRNAFIEPIAFNLPGTDRFVLTRKLQSYIRQAKVPMPDRLETYNHLCRTPAEELFDPGFLQSVDVNSPRNQLREIYSAIESQSPINTMLALDWKFTLADNDIRKVNLACEFAGVQVRYPFLDEDLVEFSTCVPAKMKINRFRLRHFFKRAMRDFLPEEVLHKSKHGFGMPFGIWMKTFEPLRELAYDSLASLGHRGIVSSSYISNLIDHHRKSHAHYYGEFIWVLMALELWLQEHHDNFPKRRPE